MAAVFAGLLMSMTMVPAAVMAAPDPAKGPAGAGVSMHVDCSSVPDTKEARAATRRYHICEQSSGGIAPMGTVSNNCGELSLNVSNRGGGLMQWTTRITSRLGPFTSGSYSGTWSNATLFRQGPVNHSRFGFTSDWVDSFAIGTGAGSVFGVLSFAAIQLWWGPFCISSLPVDSHTIVT